VSLLDRIKQYLVQKNIKGEKPRVFLKDEELIATIKDVAKRESRTEEEIVAEFTKAGLNQFLTQNELDQRWASLSQREQQVVALICLGHRNYEIANILGIAPETVKTHLQRIFDKFQLRSSKELRLALQDWNFRDWWENNQHI
jgi:DNA-binding CsgD family transcriptional regulator